MTIAAASNMFDRDELLATHCACRLVLLNRVLDLRARAPTRLDKDADRSDLRVRRRYYGSAPRMGF